MKNCDDVDFVFEKFSIEFCFVFWFILFICCYYWFYAIKFNLLLDGLVFGGGWS